jgi:hypothetical protein
VAGGVDQVDRDVACHERDHRRLDRDPALPFERERVGPGAAAVDTADFVDDARVVEQAFRGACLAGVDVRQDAPVQRLHCASCPSSGSGWRWT